MEEKRRSGEGKTNKNKAEIGEGMELGPCTEETDWMETKGQAYRR